MYETIRQGCQKLGPDYARKPQKRQGRLGDRCNIDEVFVTMQDIDTICIGQSIRRAISLIFFSSLAATSGPQNGFSAIKSKATTVSSDG
jgi:hypothetical protein